MGGGVKKTSVLTTLYTWKCPFFLDFTQSWVRVNWGQDIFVRRGLAHPWGEEWSHVEEMLKDRRQQIMWTQNEREENKSDDQHTCTPKYVTVHGNIIEEATDYRDTARKKRSRIKLGWCQYGKLSNIMRGEIPCESEKKILQSMFTNNDVWSRDLCIENKKQKEDSSS